MEMQPVTQTTLKSRRREDRTNTFVMATLLTDATSSPVRIRNLSSGGALLAGYDLPARGERCRLRRGEKSVSGIVLRSTGEEAAIKFARPILVHGWLAAGHAQQREVDRVVHEARHRYPVADSNHRIASLRVPHGLQRDDLLDMADQLDRLADSLSRDRHVVAKFNTRLQVLDIISQRLRAPD
ncbi:MAG: hypothetical protein KDD90_05490 [Sphingomonadaceae bacterium]|jgi:hypothetical protein|nr:hypothetical protein [Sphingomonadaceae bacterium]